MAKRAKQAYQYEAPVTPSGWTGEEQRFSIRVKAILEDLYQKFGSLASRPTGTGGGVETVNGIGPDEAGNVKLTASNVGARPSNWMPSASDVGALPVSGKAADSSKLGGKTLSQLMLSMYPVGSAYTTTSSALSPASFIGGTWALADKSFASLYLDSGFFTPGEGVTVSSMGAIINGHTIRIRISLSYNADLADTAVTMGTVDWAKIGIDVGNTATTYFTGVSDTGNGLSLATLHYETGVLSHTDVVGKAASIAANSPLNYCCVINTLTTRMLDHFCNQFVWERVS